MTALPDALRERIDQLARKPRCAPGEVASLAAEYGHSVGALREHIWVSRHGRARGALRWCAWCGDDLSRWSRRSFCSDSCRDEFRADVGAAE